MLLLGAGAAFGCARPQLQQVPAGTEFELPIGSGARVNGGPDVTFVRLVEDSRCPIDAVCIQAGRATVRLAVTRSGRRREIQLSTREGPPADTAFGYEIRLIALLPPPRAAAPTPTDSYRATILVDSLRQARAAVTHPW